MRAYFLLFFMGIGSLLSYGQTYEIGGVIGGTNYIGDVGRTNYISPNTVHFGGIFKWNRGPRHAFRFTLIQSNIKGDDTKSDEGRRRQRGFSFTNSITEASLGLEFNFVEFSMYSGQPQRTPYLYTGLTYFRYNALFKDPNTDVIRKFDTAWDFAIPMVVGYKATLGTKMVLGLEIGARYTLTDDLDGSNPIKDLENDESLKFGNLNSDDWYVFTGVTLTFTFGRQPCYCNF